MCRNTPPTNPQARFSRALLPVHPPHAWADKKVRLMNAQSLVAKVWNFAHVLRDQGVSYQAYISQISYLLFLKMDEERVSQIGEASSPAGARWGDIKELSGEALNAPMEASRQAVRQGGIIGAIFLKAQNEIQDPAKLKRLVGADRQRDLAWPAGGREGRTSTKVCSRATRRR